MAENRSQSHILLRISIPVILLLVLFTSFTSSKSNLKANSDTDTEYPTPKQFCLTCHTGIDAIREHNSKMAKQIYEMGVLEGDPNGCVVCHAGNPDETKNKNIAHQDMIKFSGSLLAYDKTCGICHEDYDYNLERNLMQTEAGKIQGVLWGWGAMTGYERKYGNYDVVDTDGPVPNQGSEKYKKYMRSVMTENPDVFPSELREVPETDLSRLEEHPDEAVFTYIRNDCLRCHVGVRGAQRRGDYRGMGCAACHIPFSAEGLYEGKDPSIPKDEAGHLLVHSIQSSRKAKVTVNDKTYSGIPAETCTSCHNRGKRIGVSYLGMVESPYDTPWDDQGDSQSKLHGKRYAYIGEDHHHSPETRPENPDGAMTCQDCHTTLSMHGNGNIGGATLGEVEIECADCHGTPEKYPWELPLGFMEEYQDDLAKDARGTTDELLEWQEKFGTTYPLEDGYLLSARGNPLGNAVRMDNKVLIHTCGGVDLWVPLTKNLSEAGEWEKGSPALTAMKQVSQHMESLECYTCHAGWAPQCYGCHVKVDFSNNSRSVDWVKSGVPYNNGATMESKIDPEPGMLDGKITQGRSYIRWEDPVLGINGEGRVSPIIPGCQQITTVISPDGTPLINNKIWRTPGNMEGSGPEGQRGIDMTPVQPHTITAKARPCVSCHTNPKSLGYGISDGKLMSDGENDTYIDLKDGKGELIPGNTKLQFSTIDGLDIDLSQVVTRDGKQVQTVGHHWPLSGPLPQETRDKMERVGVCISCHQDIPDGTLPVVLTAQMGKILDMTPYSDKEHSKLLNKDLRWSSLSRFLIGGMMVVIGVLFYLLIKQGKRQKAEGRRQK